MIFGNFFRLVEDDAFMQYDLRNGNSVALAEFPPELVNQSLTCNLFFQPRLQVSEADSLNKKVVALQWQFIKARVHEFIFKKLYSLMQPSFYEVPLQ